MLIFRVFFNFVVFSLKAIYLELKNMFIESLSDDEKVNRKILSSRKYNKLNDFIFI